MSQNETDRNIVDDVCLDRDFDESVTVTIGPCGTLRLEFNTAAGHSSNVTHLHPRLAIGLRKILVEYAADFEKWAASDA